MSIGEIYLVAGATGGLGQQIVSRLLLRGKHVRALVRDVQKSRALLGENLEHVQGDTRQPDALHEAVNGVSTVICVTGTRSPEGANSPEAVDYEGVRNLVNAAKASGVAHFMLISSIGATQPDHPLNKQFGRVLEWKQKGEQALRRSGVAYTIIRPGGLTDEPGGQQAIQIGQGDKLSGRIARADVAEVCLQALSHPNTVNTTFEVIGVEGEPPSDWDAFFADLKRDEKESENA